jgi:hypothetical protein
VAEGAVAQGAGVTFAAGMPVGAAHSRFLLLSGWEGTAEVGWEGMGVVAAGWG